jgi:LacI family transcriptional regulator
LRNHPSLPAATRERLQRLAREMGYQPDPALSALVAYRHPTRARRDQPTLAYVTNWNTALGWKESPAHRCFYEGAKEKASVLGFQLEHFWLGEPGMTHRRMSGILVSRGIPGLVLASHRRESDEPLDFDWPQFSAVKIDFIPRQPELHRITNDQSAIIRLAVQRVLAAGYRRIGLVMPRWWDEFVDLAWSAGFLAEQQRLPREDRIPILFYSLPERPRESPADRPVQVVPSAALKAWLEENRPEVLLSRRMFVVPALAALGWSVPADIRFVEIFLEETDGRTAGVRQNCHRVGEVAVELLSMQLQQHIRGVPEVATATFVEGTWFDGETLPRRRP